jgi:hypothetical protein
MIGLIQIRGTRRNQFGMVEIKHDQQLRGHGNFIVSHQVELVLYVISMPKAFFLEGSVQSESSRMATHAWQMIVIVNAS